MLIFLIVAFILLWIIPRPSCSYHKQIVYEREFPTVKPKEIEIEPKPKLPKIELVMEMINPNVLVVEHEYLGKCWVDKRDFELNHRNIYTCTFNSMKIKDVNLIDNWN